MDITCAMYSAIGQRETNEDSADFLKKGDCLLAIVADGLGGLDDGEVASSTAVDVLLKQLRYTQDPDEDELYDAIQAASQKINATQAPPSQMRTTVAVLWINGQTAVAANVGDTRIYQFRDGEIIYQSMDHSVAQMAVLVGDLKESELRTSKERNRLIRVLGDEIPPKADTETLSVQSGDRFLLCSDGFWEPVTEADMVEAAQATASAEAWLDAMRSYIGRPGKPEHDNNTAIAVFVT